MAAARATVRFCRLAGGAQVAYASMGAGSPLVMVPGWLCHLEQNWTHHAAASARAKLAASHRFVWYDRLGCGLSDRDGFVLSLERVEALLAAGDREAVIEASYREMLKLTEEQLAEVRAQPSWPARVAVAHTGPREIRTFLETTFDPELAAKITVPTLLLVGSESPDVYDEATVADALPDARIHVLEGQEHIADLLAPGLVAGPLLAFLGRA